MNVVLAESAGACYGVQRALELAGAAAESGKPAYTLGPLIHNPAVVRDLAERGVFVADSIGDIDGGVAVIRSHGVAPDVLDELAESGLEVVDATCPHVARAQRAAAELGRRGYRVLVVGEKGHPEVEGLTAHARREGALVDVVSCPEDLPDDLDGAIGVVVQTTQRAELLAEVLGALRARGVEPAVKETICSATRQRQDAAARLAGEVDAMVVVGGRNSSNTTRLAEICRVACARTFHIESPGEIEPSWFDEGDTVGLTAGASTPESQIRAAMDRLRRLF